MKQPLVVLILTIQLFLMSCIDSTRPHKKQNQENKDKRTQLKQDYSINEEDLLKDLMTWYTYTYHNIKLAQDFIGLNADSVIISKSKFLKQLETGNYVPFKIMALNKMPIYRLYKLRKHNEDIQSAMKGLALNERLNYEMEGKEFPAFNFKDLNGKIYNKQTTKGKFLIIKCWFIHCGACIKEFPELNDLVNQYNLNSKILFISLAMDSENELKNFLTKKEFQYAVIPDQKSFMSKQMDIKLYPTHLVINTNGKILKAVNSVKDLTLYLKQVFSPSVLSIQ